MGAAIRAAAAGAPEAGNFQSQP